MSRGGDNRSIGLRDPKRQQILKDELKIAESLMGI